MEAQRSLITAWRHQTLLVLLRVQAIAWLPGYLAGCLNAFLSYQHITIAQNTLFLSISIYTAAYGSLLLIAFLPRLSYRARIFVLLTLYYVLGAGLLRLSALSGDARLILLIFVLLAAIFLENPYPYLALSLAIFNMGIMGWMHLSRIIQLDTPIIYNAHNPIDWVSGSVVFSIIGLSMITITQFLLNSFALTLKREQTTIKFIALENEINQAIAREKNAAHLLSKVYAVFQHNGYNTWLGMFTPHPQTITFQTAQNEPMQRLAQQTAESGQIIQNTPLLSIPLLRENRILGVIVVQLVAQELSEMQFFEKIAQNLASAIDAIQNNDKQQTLTRIAEELAGELNTENIWKTILSGIQQILNTNRAALYEYSYQSDDLACSYFNGVSETYVQKISQNFRLVPGSQLLSNPQPILIEDTRTSPHTQKVRTLLESESILSYAIFRLARQKRTIGGLAVYYSYPHRFSNAEVEFGQTLAYFFAAALENARLFCETRTKSNEQTALFIAAQEMSARMEDFSALLKLIGQQMLLVLNVTSVYILRADEKTKTFEVLSEYWSEYASPAERKSDLGRFYLMEDYPLIASAAKKGIPLWINDNDPRLAPAEQAEVREYGIRSMLFIPLIWQGTLVGLAELWESRRNREFTQHEIQLAQTLASYAASALRMAKLFGEIEAREAYFRALTENASEGVAVLSAQGEFKYISRVQEQILGYDNAQISLNRLTQKLEPKDLAAVRKAFLKSKRSPNTLVTVLFSIQNQKGRRRILEATLNNLLENPAIQGIVVNFRDVTQQKQAEQQLQQAYDETLSGWARALELRDQETEGHTRRVTELTIRLARAMNIDEEQIVHIRRGALLHDIGKVAIPDSILHKAETLTSQEWDMMRQHPQYAYDMLKEIAYLRPALEIPYCHHEKWDGTGYPRGLKGKEIPLAARIFAVADVWDALISNRPYRPGWETAKTLQYIKEQSGKHFDPDIVEVFINLVKREGLP